MKKIKLLTPMLLTPLLATSILVSCGSDKPPATDSSQKVETDTVITYFTSSRGTGISTLKNRYEDTIYDSSSNNSALRSPSNTRLKTQDQKFFFQVPSTDEGLQSSKKIYKGIFDIAKALTESDATKKLSSFSITYIVSSDLRYTFDIKLADYEFNIPAGEFVTFEGVGYDNISVLMFDMFESVVAIDNSNGMSWMNYFALSDHLEELKGYKAVDLDTYSQSQSDFILFYPDKDPVLNTKPLPSDLYAMAYQKNKTGLYSLEIPTLRSGDILNVKLVLKSYYQSDVKSEYYIPARYESSIVGLEVEGIVSNNVIPTKMRIYKTFDDKILTDGEISLGELANGYFNSFVFNSALLEITQSYLDQEVDNSEFSYDALTSQTIVDKIKTSPQYLSFSPEEKVFLDNRLKNAIGDKITVYHSYNEINPGMRGKIKISDELATINDGEALVVFNSDDSTFHDTVAYKVSGFKSSVGQPSPWNPLIQNIDTTLLEPHIYLPFFPKTKTGILPSEILKSHILTGLKGHFFGNNLDTNYIKEGDISLVPDDAAGTLEITIENFGVDKVFTFTGLGTSP